MTRLATARGMPVTTSAIEASSFRAGIATTTGAEPDAAAKGFAASAIASMISKTPAQAAARTGGWRLVGQKRVAKRAISLPVPDFAQRLPGGVAERVVLIAALREGRDAAGQRAPVGGEIHDGPRAAAHRPGRVAVLALQAHARLGGSA